MPKNRQEYENDCLFPFFFNMLSEGFNRKLQSKLLKIDEKDSFGLLMATARYDTIGAITLNLFSKMKMNEIKYCPGTLAKDFYPTARDSC